MPRGRARAFDYEDPPERPADPAVRRAYLRRVRLVKIRLVVCEPIPVERAKPTVAAARKLTAELEKRVDAAR